MRDRTPPQKRTSATVPNSSHLLTTTTTTPDSSSPRSRSQFPFQWPRLFQSVPPGRCPAPLAPSSPTPAPRPPCSPDGACRQRRPDSTKQTDPSKMLPRNHRAGPIPLTAQRRPSVCTRARQNPSSPSTMTRNASISSTLACWAIRATRSCRRN